MERKVNARDTFVREIDSEISQQFVSENHRMGSVSPGKRFVSYGLFLEEELLAVAQFCNPRTSGMQKKYTRELLRLAFKDGVRVRGGASKLIGFFIKDKNPVDFFTYQDTSGELTDVYEKSGMALASKRNPTKKVLVRNGISFLEAENNRKDWFSIEQAVRRGPDSLIGTNLGEVFREDGSRKSNLDLFLEDCGYHLEEIAGDRIYEWLNPSVRFYTYRITSSVDEKYYYGRRVIWGDSVSREDCLHDGYMGSGGKKFRNWVAEVGVDKLRKEVLSIHSSWKEVVKAESKLIGKLYETDPLCMNTLPGGTGLSTSFKDVSVADCPTHGESKHMGKTCLRCASEKSIEIKNCPIHGETKYRGGNCLRCVVGKARWKDRCPVHGESSFSGSGCLKCLYVERKFFKNGVCSIHGRVKFMGDDCCRCLYEKRTPLKNCEIHGVSYFVKGICSRCKAESLYSLKDCPIHGESIHRKDLCLPCLSEKFIGKKFCEKHGETIHRGETCSTCQADSSRKIKNCPIHGEVIHWGDSCSTCTAQKSVSVGECPTHGRVKFVGDHCRICLNQSVVSMKFCPIHGETKHQGDSCCRCSKSKSFSLKICPIHGETKFNGDSCVKCLIGRRNEVKVCPTHGQVKFLNGRCSHCESSKQFTIKNCEYHGEAKFKGNSCCRCTSEKTAHSRFHGKKKKEGCHLCSAESAEVSHS